LDSLKIDVETYPQKNIQRLQDGEQIMVDTEYHKEVDLRRSMYAQDAQHIYTTSGKRNYRKDELAAARLISRSLAQQSPEIFSFKRNKLRNKKSGESIDFANLKSSPLEQIAQHIQEDVIIVRKNSDGEYSIRSGFLAFPSNWYIHHFLDAPMSAIHQGLGKNNDLGRVINNVLEILPVGQPIRRNNWFINDDPTQAQTLSHYGKSDFTYKPINAKNVLERLYFRSEYQTLSKLDSGAVMFTIKVQTFRLADAVEQPQLAKRLLRGIVLKQESHPEILPDYYKHLVLELAKHTREYAGLKTYKKTWQEVKSTLQPLLK
jgi:hypothetical protein